MKTCNYCNSTNTDTAIFCSKCGSDLRKQIQSNSTSGMTIFLCIVSLLLPIVGYILYFMNRKTDKNKANTILACAIGGSVFGLIMVFAGA